jgi:hypothetical protein
MAAINSSAVSNFKSEAVKAFDVLEDYITALKNGRVAVIGLRAINPPPEGKTIEGLVSDHIRNQIPSMNGYRQQLKNTVQLLANLAQQVVS